MDKKSNVKAICTVALFMGAVTVVAYGVSYFKYSGKRIDEDYAKMCDQVQNRILLRQEVKGEFATKVKEELSKLKADFKDASISERARRFVEMQRQFVDFPCNGNNMTVPVSYNGVVVTKDGELSAFPKREKYYFLERQLAVNWETLQGNETAKSAWNKMVAKIEAAEASLRDAETAMIEAEAFFNPLAKK